MTFVGTVPLILDQRQSGTVPQQPDGTQPQLSGVNGTLPQQPSGDGTIPQQPSN